MIGYLATAGLVFAPLVFAFHSEWKARREERDTERRSP